MKRITAIVLICLTTSLLSNGQLIINHLNTNITTLTEAEINLAKQKLHIAYGHTSHGSQVTDGMTGLVAFANGGGKGLTFPVNIFRWNNGGSSGALDLHDYAMGGDVGYYPAWRNNTLSYLGTVDPVTGRGQNNPDVNVIMWSWCGQAADYSENKMINDYLTPMNQLETTYFGVKFIYMTCHLNGTGATGNLHLRNEQIRNFCLTNHKILYDFADIESYDPDGLVNYMLLFANDNCDYDSDNNSSLDKNWAQDWQDSHTQNVDWYDVSCAHSQSLNGNQKAFAAWRMYAEIAKIMALEDIPSNVTVSDTLVGTGVAACFNATDTLTVAGDDTAVEFQNGSVVDLIAGNTIRLLPGFHAFEGSTVSAVITSTDQYCFSNPVGSPIQPAEKSTVFNDSQHKLNATSKEFGFTVYPNPGNGKVTIALTGVEGSLSITITNSLGKVVDRRVIQNEKQVEVETTNYSKGIYLFNVQSKNSVKTQKVIIL